MVIPRALRQEAGVAEGTLMKVDVIKSGQFLLTAQIAIDRPEGRQNRKQLLKELAQVVAEIRQEAKEKGLDKMPMKEINRAVAAARRDLKKSGKQAVK